MVAAYVMFVLILGHAAQVERVAYDVCEWDVTLTLLTAH
jgi:hypothetical protein